MAGYEQWDRNAVSDPHLRLVGAVIRAALVDEGPDYLKTPGAEFWLEALGARPDFISSAYAAYLEDSTK